MKTHSQDIVFAKLLLEESVYGSSLYDSVSDQTEKIGKIGLVFLF